MKNLSKFLLVSCCSALLMACGNNANTSDEEAVLIEDSDPIEFGGYTVQDLQGDANVLHFATNQYAITEQNAQLLDAQASYLIDNPAVKVQVQGHADEIGTPEYNIALGQRRADSVKKYLVSKGVNPSQITTISFGEEKPVALGHTEEEHAKNRRAVLAY